MSMTAQFNAPIAVRYKDWTPRQKQVLDLLLRGQTNSQIAASLGISLDGAKWHVSEIITRLGVDTREEAADYWRTQNGIPARLFRAVQALVPGIAAGKVVAGGVGLGLVAGLVVAVIVAWPGPEADAPAEGTGPDPVPSITAGNPSTPSNVPLTNGSSNYAYIPALSYVAPGGEVQLVDIATGDSAAILDGCTGLGSPKANILTGGLRWSANGEAINCLTDTMTVRGANADGTNQQEIFAPNACEAMLESTISPDGQVVSCRVNPTSQLEGIRLTSANGEVEIPATMNRAAWSPNGQAVIVASQVVTSQDIGRMTFNVHSLDGTQLGTVSDAYVADPRTFAWSLDGLSFAYPGDQGITVIDLANGWDVRHFLLADNSGQGGGNLAWVLGDEAILATVGNERVILALADGKMTPLADAPYNGNISWDGELVAYAKFGPGTTPQTETVSAAILNLRTGVSTTIPGFQVQGGGIGLGPEFVFSGDSSRVCWTPSPVAATEFYCADVAGGSAFKVAAPVTVETDMAGYGDASYLWRAFSPDLQKVAYTTPGLADAAAPQTLWVSDLDGSNAVQVGPALGPLPYEWRPDAVYRPYAALQ